MLSIVPRFHFLHKLFGCISTRRIWCNTHVFQLYIATELHASPYREALSSVSVSLLRLTSKWPVAKCNEQVRSTCAKHTYFICRILTKFKAILSVYDKTGLLDLAKGLIKNNIRLLASGGTAKLIREAGFNVEYVPILCFVIRSKIDPDVASPVMSRRSLTHQRCSPGESKPFILPYTQESLREI